MQVCGDCLHRYKHVKDFCPSCFKLYAMDESMQPLYGATLCVPVAGSSADSAVVVVPVFAPEESLMSGASSSAAAAATAAAADPSAGPSATAAVDDESMSVPMEVEGTPEKSAADGVKHSGDAGQSDPAVVDAPQSNSREVTSAPAAAKPAASSEDTFLTEDNMVCFHCN